MYYITNSIFVWQWRYPVPLRQLLVNREKEKRRESEWQITSQMLIFSRLVWAQRTRADELSTEFLTQWCQTGDCDVRLTQVKSITPAGNMQTETQTDCYQVCVAISVFGDADDTFALQCLIKETVRGDGIWKILDVVINGMAVVTMLGIIQRCGLMLTHLN